MASRHRSSGVAHLRALPRPVRGLRPLAPV